jgi:hypothetical protein
MPLQLTATLKLVMTPSKVLEAADKMKRRNLYKTGALVRTIARNSIRRGKSKANPGQPPIQHTNPGLKLIKFSVLESDEVYVYTEPFQSVGIDVPKTLEDGGYQRLKKNRKRSKYLRHPFLAPAEVKARDKYPELWANSFG